MVYPLLPAFVATVLGAPPVFLGLIEGLAETTASLARLASGVASDRLRRRKPLASAGYLLANALRPALGLATAWPHVLALRFGDRLGKGVRSAPRDALLADSVPAERRGVAFGWLRALDHAGAVIGPLVALGLLHAGLSLRDVFFLSLVPGLLAVVAFVGVRARGPLCLGLGRQLRASASGGSAPAAAALSRLLRDRVPLHARQLERCLPAAPGAGSGRGPAADSAAVGRLRGVQVPRVGAGRLALGSSGTPWHDHRRLRRLRGRLPRLRRGAGRGGRLDPLRHLRPSLRPGGGRGEGLRRGLRSRGAPRQRLRALQPRDRARGAAGLGALRRDLADARRPRRLRPRSGPGGRRGRLARAASGRAGGENPG